MVISLAQLEYVYKLLNKKNMCNNNCNENNNTTTNQCGCKTSTDDVVYNGPELTCTNIQTCDTLTSAISNISNFLCSIDMVQIIINNITNNINLYNQFTTIVNNTVDCETVWDCISATTTTTTTLEPTTTTTTSSSTSTTTSTSTSTSTSTTTSTTSSTTTTTTTIPITIDCITYLASDGNVYMYDPITNLSIDLFNDDSTYFNVLNTNTKLFAMVSGGYTREYNLTFNPGPIPTYNRAINTGNNVSPIFAINDFTLIAWDNTNKLVTELDVTTNTAVSTTKGSIQTGYDVTDGILTTSGKLILVAINTSNINNISTRIYQYNYSTWTLEIIIDVTDQLPTFLISAINVRSYIIGISQYQGKIYLFSRVIPCSTVPGVTSRVYNLDLLTNFLVYTGNDTGFTCGNSASSQLICNTVDIDPNITPCLKCSLSDVTIGTQTWTACNLSVDKYRNGDTIPQATNMSEWQNLTTGAWCYYNFDPANECIYGKLYNWYAINDPRGLAPVGYHIPTLAEFATLSSFLGTNVGGKLKEAGLAHWTSPNTGATNATGFTGLPGGYVSYFGSFYNINDYGYMWASDEYSSTLGNYYRLDYNADTFNLNGSRKDSGISVRLVKDSSITTTTTTLAPTGFNTIYTHFESL